jgi:hypothetical protein
MALCHQWRRNRIPQQENYLSALSGHIFMTLVTSWQISHRGSNSSTEEVIPHNVLSIKVLTGKTLTTLKFSITATVWYFFAPSFSLFYLCSHIIGCNIPTGSDSALHLHLSDEHGLPHISFVAQNCFLACWLLSEKWSCMITTELYQYGFLCCLQNLYGCSLFCTILHNH